MSFVIRSCSICLCRQQNMCVIIYPSDDYSCRTAYYQTGFLYYLLNQYLGKIWGREQLLVPLNHMLKKYYTQSDEQDDLISIGTIGLIKAVNTYRSDKNIKLATYASRCIENEILMYLRRNSKTKMEVSIDEPLNVDWDGNELLLSDILGTEEDVIYQGLEQEAEHRVLGSAISKLSEREQVIVKLRFGINMPEGREKTQKEVADLLGISQSYISRLEKRIMKRLRKEIARYE
mgnify:CR=1 FL=1